MKKSKILLCSLLAGVCFTGGMVCVNANADGEVTPITANQLGNNFYMTEGAWVRMADDYENLGMRFQLNMDAETYKAFTANTDYTNVSYGVLIAPIDYHKYVPLDDETNLANKYNWKVNGELAFETTGRKEIINLSTPAMLENEQDASLMTFYASVVNMKTENLTREYVGVGYVRYDADENGDGEAETHYEFAKFDNSYARSMTYIAQQAIENGKDVNNLLLNSYVNHVKTQDTTLLVEHYFQNEDGTYPTEATQTTTQTAKIDSEATAQLQTAYGYRYMPNPNEVLAGKVYAGGKTVLKAYYAKANNYDEQAVFTYTKDNSVTGETVENGDGCYTDCLTSLDPAAGVAYLFTKESDGATQATKYQITLPKVNYASCEEVNFTVAYNYSVSNVILSVGGTTVHQGFLKNEAVPFALKKQADGNMWLFVDGWKKVAISNEVVNGIAGLTIDVERQHVDAQNKQKPAIVFSSMTGKFAGAITLDYLANLSAYNSTLGTYSTADIASSNAQFIGVNAGTKNIGFCTKSAAGTVFTMPKINYNNYESVSFTCTFPKTFSELYYPNFANPNNKISLSACNYEVLVEVKRQANGTMTMYYNGVAKYVLSANQANGVEGIQLCAIPTATYQVFTISPMTATPMAQQETAIDVQTLAISATTISTQTNDQPQVAKDAANARQIVWLYNNTVSGNTYPVSLTSYSVTIGGLNYSDYVKVGFEFVTGYTGMIQFGENEIAVTKEATVRIELYKQANGAFGVYMDGVKQAEVKAEDMQNGWTFTIRTTAGVRYQNLIVQAPTVLK